MKCGYKGIFQLSLFVPLLWQAAPTYAVVRPLESLLMPRSACKRGSVFGRTVCGRMQMQGHMRACK